MGRGLPKSTGREDRGTTLDIDTWLCGIGLGQYAGLFHANDIDADLLSRLTAEDLKDMGIASLGHRKKLLDAIAALGTGTDAPAPPPAMVTPPAVAERRHLTVMFVDLVGSTALSAELDPEDMRELIRTYQNTVAGEITRFEGHIAQFLGDGVLAYFGWPRAHEDDAERAVRAGLGVTASAARLTTPANAPLRTRTGVATGMVVVGDLIAEGATKRHAVVGETPNLAARLQGMAEAGTVVIDGTTRQLLGDLFALNDLGPQQLKGIADPVPAFAVVGEREIQSRFAARQSGAVTPIVGRDQELALLLERWQQAKSGDGQAVLLTGEAGIGKSRLTEALLEAVAGEPHFLLRYQCSPYHGDSALYPVIQQLAHAAGFTAEDGTERRLDRLEALLATAVDGVGAAAPLIAALMDLDGEPRYGPLALTPQQRRNRTLAVLVQQLAGLASQRPVLWVVEDAHWIDPTTLELIELSLDRASSQRVLVLITARPTFAASFGSHPAVTRLALNRLARAATQSIVVRITRGKRLPAALLEEIAARTDGVPLFVEEMTKAVIESAMLREDADSYHLDGPLSALAIPTTLHNSLMARLDRLQPVKAVAQTAAVIGRSFDHRTIAALAARSEPELAEAMRRLVEAELIFRRGTPPEATYLFKHALVRDAAYESLLKSERLALHARLLEVLENTGEATPEVKAQHAEAAGLAERAIDYWEQAAVQALARPAYKEAIASFESAIRLCLTLSDGSRWKRREQGLQLQLGQALIANRGYQAPATMRAFERALALASEMGDVALQVPALFGQWASVYIGGGDLGDLAQRFASLAESQPETGPRLVGLRMVALERFHEGHFEDSLALVRRSLAVYDPAAHRDLVYRFGHDPRAAAANYAGWNLWHLGFPDQALRVSEDNLRWARQVDHANTTGIVLCYGVSLLNIWLRRPARVEVAAREALRLAEDNSMDLWHAWAQIYLGWVLSQTGTESGLEEIEAGLREARQIGAGRLEPLHLGLAAEAYARAARPDEARDRLVQAFTALAQGRDLALAAELHRLRAILAVRHGVDGLEAPESDLRRALEIARRQEARLLELRAARDLASLLAARGECQQARDVLAPVYAWFTEGFDTPDLKEARALIDALRTSV